MKGTHTQCLLSACEQYDRIQYKYQSKDGLQLIDKLALQKGDSVLDLGCGTGFLASTIAEMVGPHGRVVGIDPNRERINFSQIKYSQYENLKFLHGSSDNDFPDAPYDLIFSNHVLHWIEDKASIFEKVYKSLKEGGYFAFVCPTDKPSYIWDLLDPALDQSVHLYSSDEYCKTALDCGFEVVYSAVESMIYTFDSAQDFIDFVYPSRGTSADIESTDMRFNEFKKHFADKKVHLDWTRLMLILKRL